MSKVKLYSKRHTFTGESTLSSLYHDKKLIMFVCEDVQRVLNDYNGDGDFDDEGEGKIYGETAIPKGTYDVEITWSPKYKRMMPLIKGVVGFKGIRIHSGNTKEDTLGCLLVGMGITTIGVSDSRIAYKKLMKILEGATEIELEIL